MNEINFTIIRKNPLMIPVFIAKELGIFNKYNLEVNLDINDDFTFDKNIKFIQGKTDAMVGDLTFFFYMLEQGKKAVITSTMTRTIYVVGGRNLPKDMNNLKVGVNRSGLFRLFLENDLKNIMPSAEPIWINNSYERLNALDKGEIDALVAIEPFVSDALDIGGDIIWASKDSDKNLVMWAFDKDFYENNKESVKYFHKAIEEAKSIFNSANEEERVKLAIKYADYDEKLANRLRNFEFEKGRKYSINDFNLCQEWMLREKEINKKYNGENLIVDIF